MNGLSFRFANFGNHRHSLPLPSLRSVALSVTLLPGAALLVTSFVRLSQQNIEFILKIVGSVCHAAVSAISRFDCAPEIVNQGMRPVFFGLAAGSVTALALGGLISAQLFQTSAHNPLLFAATMSILGIAALLAWFFPHAGQRCSLQCRRCARNKSQSVLANLSPAAMRDELASIQWLRLRAE
jgi:hypothetical protein